MLTPEEFNVILERVRNGTASADDLDRLRRSQQKTGEPVNINIDELTGEDVHIGDRITIEQILGQKVIYVSVEEIKTREFHQTSPYKGLKKFEPEDKDRFFGRDQFIKDLANELEQTNLILLLGASGSGKSSVVRAGLLSWLSKKWGSRLVSLTFTPDQDPFESLYASLLRYYKQAEAQVAREGREDTLTQIVTTLRQRDAYWFIFIDQFEELFTTSQADKRDRFITGLAQLNTALKLLGSAQACPVKVMATMRADFLDRLSPYPALVKATDKHRPMIAEMQLDELRQAIEQPAAQQGVVFEMGLVEEIIKDVQGQAGYLPLLQYTLNLVWETEVQNGSIHDRTLNISTYRALGGVRGALQKHVSQIYEALPEAERLAAQRVFLKLVEIGGDEESGTEWKPVRRRAARSEFDTELERRVLVRLIDENLLVSDQQPQALASTVEIAHEALLTSWETLNTWIKENRQAIALRNRLNDDVARWQAKKTEDELWTGSKLEQVLELKKNPTFNQVMGGFSATANQFIDTSLGLRDRQLRRARIVAGIGITLAALTGAGAIFAGYQLQQAARQRVEQYAANSESLLATNPTEALVYAISATGLSRSPLVKFPHYTLPRSVEKSLLNAVQTSREENVFQVLESKIFSVAFSPDGQQILTASGDGIVRTWDLKDNPSRELFRVPDYSKWEVRFSSNEQQIITRSPEGKFQLMDLMGKPVKEPFDGPREFVFGTEEPISVGEVSPNKQWIVGYIETTPTQVILWNLQNYSERSVKSSTEPPLKLYTFQGGAEQIERDSFSYNGQWFIGAPVGSNNLTIVDLRKETRPIKKLLKVPSEGTGITSAEISSDGHILAVGDGRGNVNWWHLSIDEVMRSSSEHFSLENIYVNSLSRGHTDRVESLTFSSDGQYVASGSQDGTIRLWGTNSPDSSSASMNELLGVQGSAVKFLLFSPDGKHIVSRGFDGIIHLWDTQINPTEERLEKFHSSRQEYIRTQGITRLASVTFSPDGQYIIVKANDNYAGLIEKYLTFDLHGQLLPEEKQKEIISKIDMQVNSKLNLDSRLSFSPDGQRIVSITGDNQSLRMNRVSPESWLRTACNRLHYHPILTKPETDVAREAKATCEQYVWSKNQSSETPVSEVSASPQAAEAVKPTKPPEVTPTPIASQPPPTPIKPTPAPTVSPSPSPSTNSYKFELPKASCGDPSAKPGSAFPVFIDNKPLEEIRKKYCADAYPVSQRQKTGKPSVQVASFIDRQKAEAFAKEVGGEVGEP